MCTILEDVRVGSGDSDWENGTAMDYLSSFRVVIFCLTFCLPISRTHQRQVVKMRVDVFSRLANILSQGL
jgi:hypothetical protein